MSLPYSYKNFYETDKQVAEVYVMLQKCSKVKNISVNENIIEFVFSTNFFGIKNTVTLDFRNSDDGFHYEFQLQVLIKFAIIFIILLAFLISEIKQLLIFSSISIFVIYLISIFQINSTLEKIFDRIIKEKISPEEISEEQQNWIKDTSKCPACGHSLTEFDEICPECRINLTYCRRTKKQPASRTGYFDYRITYSYYNSSKKT